MIGEVFSVPARIGFTVLLLSVPFVAGLSLVSPWWILPMAFVFVMADVMGKWRLMFRGAPLSKVAGFALKALAVQPFVVGAVYLLGLALGLVTGAPSFSPFLEGMTALHIAVYAVVMYFAGLLLIWLEHGKPDLEAAMKEEFKRAARTSAQKNEGIAALAEPVTAETFFDWHHHSNKDYEADALKDTAYVREADIAAREAELGVTLPEGVRALYLRQNGGGLRDVYAGDWRVPLEDDLTPFSGYEELVPLHSMRSLYESISDYAYEEQSEMFPKGAKRMIVLAQWYRETLFLDYRGGDVPRVGFFDFDRSENLQDDSWQDEAVFWESWETFFAQLYRQKRHG
jgi:SMI1 / KNR4 family (SUKH-1)